MAEVTRAVCVRPWAVTLALAAGAWCPAPASFAAARTATRQAERPDRALYAEAQKARAALDASARLQGRRGEWEKVVVRYRKIVARYPQSGYCDDALLAVGDLYRRMAERFKAPSLLDDAVSSYRTLVREYPSSSHAEEALWNAFEIGKEASDRRRLTDAARAYLDAFPESRRAAEVKAVLKRRAPSQAAAMPKPPPPGLAQVFNLRFWSGEDSTRIVIDVEREVVFRSDRISGPERLWVDLVGTRLHPNLRDRLFPVGDGLLDQIRVGQNRDDVVRIVLDFEDVRSHNVFYLQDPPRLVVDVRGMPRTRVADADPGRYASAPAPFAAEIEKTPLPAVAAHTPLEPATASSRTRDRAAEIVTASPPPQAQPVAVAESAALEEEAADIPYLVPPPPAPASSPAIRTSQPPAPVPAATPVIEALPERRQTALRAPQPSPPPTKPTARPLGPIQGPPQPQPTPPPQVVARNNAPEPRPTPPASPTPVPNNNGSFSIARQLGLGARRIVIDAGHGGHDPGTIGRGGLQEKDLVLDVALKLERLLRGELNVDVVMTRSTDVFVPLEERTAIANARGADLFLSVHANASRNPRARGIETYFLNFAVNPHAEEVAARENAISEATLKDLQGLVKAITLNGKVDESRDFAAAVQASMVDTLKPHYPSVTNRGVHSAPFYVLIGANMPSVLSEIAFVSHPEEEKLLKTPDYREHIARSLMGGVRTYLDALNRTASRQLTGSARRNTVVAKEGRR